MTAFCTGTVTPTHNLIENTAWALRDQPFEGVALTVLLTFV
jgi:hypothetical protein